MLKKNLGRIVRWMGLQRRLSWYLSKINYTRKVCINNVEIFIPSICGVTCDASEPWMIGLLEKILREQPGAFFDVGVNVGQTLVKVKALDPQREYVGFEPNPACFSFSKDLIKINSFTNCMLLPVGLFTKDCLLPLDFPSDDVTDASASLIMNFRPSRRVHSRVFVPVFQFDSLAEILKDSFVGIVKIDVEGAELEVVKTLLGIIKRDKPVILIEILPVYSEQNDFRKKRQEELEEIFLEIDYVIFRVEKSASGDYQGLSEIEKIGVHDDVARCDYVVYPRSRIF